LTQAITSNPLSDLNSQGKERPWKDHKTNSVRISGLYHNLIIYERDRNFKKGEKMGGCADTLMFNVQDDGSKKLYQTWFCKERMCPMCAWRKSLKNAHQVDQVASALLGEQPTVRFLFLTLTCKNVFGSELRETLKMLSESFKRLIKTKALSKFIVGYYKAVEITQTNADGTYHPHMHVLLAVKSTYFKTKENYLDQSEWTSLWKQSLRVDYTPIVHVQAVKQKKAQLSDAVREVAKYATKSSDILSGSEAQQAIKLETLTDALSGLRLSSYGGRMKEIHKQLHLDDAEAENADLVHVGDEDNKETTTLTVEIYKWFGGNYHLIDGGN
jgi:plasmid rolling circle replication initiator protein Rep